MFLLSFLIIPIVAAIVLLFVKHEKRAQDIAIVAGIASLTAAVNIIINNVASVDLTWLQVLNSRFVLQADGLAKILILLTAISFPAIFIATNKNQITQKNVFLSLMLFTQAGLMGVFLAGDALLFYFFWELALIPMYFLASQWGGARRIPVTFKFFIYTFLGSVFMLIGILYLQSKTADHSFALESIKKIRLSSDQQSWLFWLFFIAFAIKLPVFPFHTWQPDTYEESPTPVTAMLSAVMVKMGILGLLRWLLPLFPIASYMWGDVVMTLAVVGIVYASFLAMQQTDLKRLIAYSSIAHIGLMTAGAFALNNMAYQGLLLQLFTHGINILGMWILADLIERKTGTRTMASLGGIAQHSPAITIFFVIISLANIALPLTNAFVGEFLLFNGILATPSNYYWVFAVVGGLGIIFSAVYTLKMIRTIFYGEANSVTQAPILLASHECWVLSAMVCLILFFGVYPQPLLNLTADFSKELFGLTDITALFRKS